VAVFLLRDLYPSGEERAIVRDALGTLLAVDQLPSAAGALVCNVETLARVAQAVEGRPVTTKNVTVAGSLGNGRGEPRVFFDVPLGTTVAELIARAGGAGPCPGEFIMGGPFTGKRCGPDDVVTKTTGAVIVAREFTPERRPLGLLVCACGASEERLREIAASMGAVVAAVERCKQAVEIRPGVLKCENPGVCPGQAEKILALRKAGAEALLIGNCSDCTNTVMCAAPRLGMAVRHSTDHALLGAGRHLIRRLAVTE